MILASPLALLRHLAILSLVWTLASCSSSVTGPGGKITKVNYYHMLPGVPVQSREEMLTFEPRHHLYGAVSSQEILDRFGHYYSIFWKVDDRSEPVKVRFEYRQALTGLREFAQEQVVDDIGRSNLTKFEIIGEDYRKNGRVTMWKVSVLRGKEELVSQTSFLWN
jgi:hypothetical protein